MGSRGVMCCTVMTSHQINVTLEPFQASAEVNNSHSVAVNITNDLLSCATTGNSCFVLIASFGKALCVKGKWCNDD